MAVVRLQYVSGCGISTIKVRWKYAGSKVYVQLNTVKVQSSAVKVQYSTETFFGTYCMWPYVKSGAGTPLCKGGGVRPQPYLFRSVATESRRSSYLGYGTALKMF